MIFFYFLVVLFKSKFSLAISWHIGYVGIINMLVLLKRILIKVNILFYLMSTDWASWIPWTPWKLQSTSNRYLWLRPSEMVRYRTWLILADLFYSILFKFSLWIFYKSYKIRKTAIFHVSLSKTKYSKLKLS